MNSKNDIPLPVALLALFLVIGGWAYLTYLKGSPDLMLKVSELALKHQSLWWISLCSLSFNLAIIGSIVKRTIGLQRQGSRLRKLEGDKTIFLWTKLDTFAVVGGMALSLILKFWISSKILDSEFTKFDSILQVIFLFICVNFGITFLLLIKLLGKHFLNFAHTDKLELPPPPFNSDCLVLGTREAM